jgi:hypothetical protein
MPINFSGKVLYANGAPAVGVRVNVIGPGQNGADLTDNPGLSNTDGSFSVSFHPFNDLNFDTPNGVSLNDLPFDWTASLHSLSSSAIWNAPIPGLQFLYTFNGIERHHTAPLIPFQKEFRLPQFPPVTFIPSQHGYRFVNSFPGYPLPFSIPALPGSDKVSPTFGLCGGMSSTAYDFILAERPVPTLTSAPNKGTKFFKYLYRRQIDTFGPFGSSVLRVGRWTTYPDTGPYGTQKRTLDEFTSIQQRLDDGNMVVLALIYVHAADLGELLKIIWFNHQVLAHSYSRLNSNSYAISIYDPNFPTRDDVLIKVTLVNNDDTQGMQSIQVVPGNPDRPVHGFFAMPYVPVIPPKYL